MKIIGKKRIRKASNYMSHIAEGEKAYIGLVITEDVATKMKEIGFKSLNPGESLVPSPVFGTVSKFNANGKHVSEKDKPKETVYREQYWELPDRRGGYNWGTAYIPSVRYPRKWIPAPWVNLSIVQSGEKSFLLAGQAIVKGETEDKDLVHRINLMLEIFGQFEVFNEGLESWQIPKMDYLQWEILPTGDMPWEVFKEHLAPVTKGMSKKKKIVIDGRLETIYQYKHDFAYRGTNGYHGYTIFGFVERNLYIFESVEYGNATYVFEGDWKQLSKMTKAEIINGNLHKHRFVHREGWKNQIRGLFEDQQPDDAA